MSVELPSAVPTIILREIEKSLSEMFKCATIDAIATGCLQEQIHNTTSKDIVITIDGI